MSSTHNRVRRGLFWCGALLLPISIACSSATQRNSSAGDNRDRRDSCCSDYRVGRGHPESKLIGRPEPICRNVVGSAQPGRSCAVV